MTQSAHKGIRVFEVGPRDGLQNEKTILDVEARLELVRRLEEAGLRDIEIGAFVHPRWVPQMAGTDELASRLTRADGVRYWALVPNERGLERALDVGVSHICLLTSSTETHSKKNLNRSLDEGHAINEALAARARAEGLRMRGYVSTAFGCPYEGSVDFDAPFEISERFLAMGVDEVSLGDTVGMGHPGEVRAAARRALDAFGHERVAFHLHDTRGLGLANILVAVEEGATILDAALGGTGGCPYAPGAAGNLPTEDLVNLLESLGKEHGLDLDALLDATRWLRDAHGITPHSPYFRYKDSQRR